MRAAGLLRLLLWPFTRLGLRAQLLLMLTLVAIFLIGDRLREIDETRNAAIGNAHRLMLQQATRAAEQQGDIVAEARALLQLAAALPHSSRFSGQACQPLFKRMVAERPWLARLSVVDATGRMFCSSGDRLLSESLADRPYFQAAVQSQDFVLSDYIISRVTQEPIIIAAAPRLRAGRLDSVVIAAMNIDWLSKSIANIGKGLGSEVLLFDSSGTVLAAFPDPDRWVGMNIGWSNLKPVMEAESGVMRWNGFDGQARILGHARLPGTRAVIGVMQPEDAILAEPYRQASYALAKLGVTGFLCFILVWLGGERLILRPLAALTRAADRLGSGNFSARVETAGLAPELNALAQGFNAMADRLAGQDSALRQANAQLTELASTDGLSGLANRRHFDERIEAEWSRAFRDGKSVALIVVDVDHFKRYNDRYGHIQGDDCLRHVADVLRAAARRPGDLASRTGGEEFALLLPGATLFDAAAVAEGVRTRVESLGIEHLDNSGGRATLSCGVAALRPRKDQGPGPLLAAADAALYRAKREGRNRVVQSEARLSLVS